MRCDNLDAACRSRKGVLDRFERGETVGPSLQGLGTSDPPDRTVREAVEAAVIDLLTDDPPGGLSAAIA